ncbi:MAG: hypothetical protein M4579_000114 [Chaenotheca gracillima]|nr:MAG: hypothetical protein M4579_000114 [Chaenotheca gracillima]
MILSKKLVLATILGANAAIVQCASSWGFDDASISVQGKGAGVGGGSKEKFSEKSPVSKDVNLGATDTLKVVLTATEDRKPARPHQAFLLLKEKASGLEASYPLTVKENGKGKVDLTQKELPLQFLRSSSPLQARLVLASFGSSAGFSGEVFDVAVQLDPNAPIASPEKAMRYGKLEEIHHIFGSGPKSPPKILSLVFTAAVLAMLPVLFGAWLSLGGNVNHLSKALGSSPIAHTLFFGSIAALEGIFFLYYTHWNLFQTLPAAAAVGSITFLSGSRALSEVQERRLSGMR